VRGPAPSRVAAVAVWGFTHSHPARSGALCAGIAVAETGGEAGYRVLRQRGEGAGEVLLP
jgi:hypothetical protein